MKHIVLVALMVFVFTQTGFASAPVVFISCSLPDV